MTTTDRTVAEVRATAYTVPTDRPEGDGTLAWDETTVVVVEAATAEPGAPVGTGWTYAPSAAVEVVRGLLADQVTGRSALDVGASWAAMARAVRNAGRPGLVGMALSAVDTALWDLKARLLDLPLHRLLGAVRHEVPVYGSGGFTTYADATMREQLTDWLRLGIPRVKIKIGEDWGTRVARDLERTAVARETVGDGTELYVDANGAYGAKQAVRVARRLDDLGVTWLEEPVSSEDHAGLRLVRESSTPDVTAGEYGYDLAYFGALLGDGAVDCVQVDVTRCGGYTEWLRIAGLAAAHGLEVSGHCAPNLHVPVALATPNLRHLEWFHDHDRIERRFFETVPDLTGGSVVLSDQPGHGLTFRRSDAERLRVA